MRNQALTGFALHQRRYRERSYILHFFSQELGRIDGVIRQLPPSLYHLSSLQSNGKSELKNFSQLDVQGQPFYLQQKALFAGFYLNEILLRLLPVEEAMPMTFQAYLTALEQLKTLSTDDEHDHQLKSILRQFEYAFLNELGYAIDYFNDSTGQEIIADQQYSFVSQEGFHITYDQPSILGQDLLQLGKALQADDIFDKMDSNSIHLMAKLYRQIFSDLLGDKPLKSRQLWISQKNSS